MQAQVINAEKQSPVQPVRPKISIQAPIGNRPQSISISKNKPAEQIENTTVNSVVAEPVNVYKVFTDEAFYKVWYSFERTLSDEKLVGFKNLNLPQRVEKNEFEVKVNNVMQETEARKLLSDAVQFLRKELSNMSITISTKIVEETDMMRSLSPEQRYMEMVAKNPQLEQFRKLLNLEID